jgi:hypothetical protein
MSLTVLDHISLIEYLGHVFCCVRTDILRQPHLSIAKPHVKAPSMLIIRRELARGPALLTILH